MNDKLLITIKENGSIIANSNVLFMEGENESKSIVANLPKKFIDKWLYIEFSRSDGEKFTSKRLTPTEKKEFLELSYPLKKEILNCSGFLKIQFVVKDQNGVIWKSDTAIFTVKSSINATEEIVEKDKDLLIDLQSQLDGKQDKLTAGRNIKIEETEQGVVISAVDNAGFITVDEADELISQKVEPAIKKSNNALETANTSIEQSQEALEKSNSAINESAIANNKANSAIVNSETANEIARTALENSTNANKNSQTAFETSNKANSTANLAIETSGTAQNLAIEAKQLVDQLDDIADRGLELANTAFNYSNVAKQTANQTSERLSVFEKATNDKLLEIEQEHKADREAIGIAIATEQELREQSDSEINARIDTEKSERESSYNFLNEKLNTETTERTTAVNDLSNRLDTEKTERETAVNGLQNTITQESNARKQSDNAINIRIDEETATREQENTAVNERIAQAEQTHETDKKALNTAITQALIDSKKYTDDIANALLGTGVEDAYNSFKEIQDLMKADDSQTADIIKSVSQNTNDIAELGNKKLDEEVYNTFKATEFTPTKTQVETNKNDIAGLKQNKLSQATFDSFHETEFEPLVEQANKNSTDITAVTNKANTNAQAIASLEEKHDSDKESLESSINEVNEKANENAQSLSDTRKELTNGTLIPKKALCDGNGKNIAETYETKTDATAKKTELTNAINEKTAQSDFEELISFIAEKMPKVVRVF